MLRRGHRSRSSDCWHWWHPRQGLGLRDGTVYHDLGPHYFDERDRRAVERRLVHRLQDLGYTVSLTPAA